MTISKTKLLIALLVIACQSTDVMIGPLKFWEVLAIGVFPLFIKQIDRKSLYFMAFFLGALALSFVAIVTNNVAYDSYGILKSKFVISIVRTIELSLCLVVANSLFNLKNYRAYNYGNIIKIFLNYNFVFILFSLLLLIIDLATGSHLVSYGQTHRLRAFYVEGGPYGLFVSTLFFLELASHRRLFHLFVLLSVLLLSQSKAGYIFTLICISYFSFAHTKQLKSLVDPRNKVRFASAIIMFIPLLLGTTYLVGKGYVQDAINISQQIAERPGDTSLVMGRIAGSYIGQNIIKNNPILGVGSGNYSLVRNNPIYRGIFPEVNKWDLGGLGGIFNILTENGIIGLCFFITSVLLFFKFNKDSLQYLILFMLPFILGAQLYMIYPWAYAGFYRLREESALKITPAQLPMKHRAAN